MSYCVDPTNCLSRIGMKRMCLNGAERQLTVWRKSLLFNCHGFTVFDSKGNLVFRVDNYVARKNAEIVLMDAFGRSLLTLRHKRISLSDNWAVYKGETNVNLLFTVRKHMNVLKWNTLLAQVMSSKRKVMYEIEGSYAQRSCVVYDEMQRRVAEIKPKEAKREAAYGGDVFRLDVDQLDITLAMAIVIVLNQMFASSAT